MTYGIGLWLPSLRGNDGNIAGEEVRCAAFDMVGSRLLSELSPIVFWAQYCNCFTVESIK